MSQERFLTVPSSGEVARPFEVLLDEASAALSADFPTSMDEVFVALDIDGTILTAAGATPCVFEGIYGLVVVGTQVFIASGHALEGIIPVLSVLGFTDGWALCNNGATFVCVSGGGCEIVEECTFVPSPVLEETVAAIPGSVFASMPHPDVLLSAPFPGNKIEGGGYRIVSMGELAFMLTPKIVARATEMGREKFGRILSSLDVSRAHGVFVSQTPWTNIEPLEVTRMSGLKSLRQRLGLPTCGTVAVGDGTNDITMIEWATFGVAMSGASEEVRAHADHVTTVVDNDGAAAVMHAIMRRCRGADC